MKKILAISSSGGHWIQLQQLKPAFEGCETHYACTDASYHAAVGDAPFYSVVDASRWNKLRLLRQALQILWILLKVKPDVIVTTGAAPGFFAVRLGKLLGKKCVWVDSIANVMKCSLSGQKAQAHVDLFLTQWPDLAEGEVIHKGKVFNFN